VLWNLCHAQQLDDGLVLNDLGYFETRGLNVLVYSNFYDGNFSDAKVAGVEMIHHGVRTATNGDVRLSPTPGQWDPVPQLIRRTEKKGEQTIEVHLSYPEHRFEYQISATAEGKGVTLTVHLEKPLPVDLEGRAGFNLEFLPSAYFEKSFRMDSSHGLFPLYPAGTMTTTAWGDREPSPIATGRLLVLAPEDPTHRISIQGENCELGLYDGRQQAQNGWFVVRTLLPSKKAGDVIRWSLTGHTIPQWTRPPVITHSQVGYAPTQRKVAVIELDKHDRQLPHARLLRVSGDGTLHERFRADLKPWGMYLRYDYRTFDFSSVTENGLYIIEYDTIRSSLFRIAPDVYENAWHATTDIFLPVQMDHMFVREAYRVWHGASHLDDALQAPVNHEHFDLYAQGPTTDTPYRPGEHIPGLNVGGWFDAGDYDIRTQTQYALVLQLAHLWEEFAPARDQTTVEQKTRYVEIHRPDGMPDVLQQVEHGVLQLLAQQKAVGHAINGIVEAHLYQYRHLGDALTKTDNVAGTPDDRWAFTSKSSALNYGSAAALAAASRVLRGYKDSLAGECLATARRIWDEEHTHPPDRFSHGNTTGGPVQAEEFKAAVELLLSTKESAFASRVDSLLPDSGQGLPYLAPFAVRAIPHMQASYAKRIEAQMERYVAARRRIATLTPFGVPISTGGWAGNAQVIGLGITNYLLHKTFPHLVDPDLTFRALEYVHGCHPGSAISFVSGVGTVSKKVAYGSNRADFTFIAGGVVPGVLVLKPDFPENKEDWPFLWGENEYVVSLGANYVYLVHAAIGLTRASTAK
jgi:hypothetical protein